jgi:hypothetical protein
MTTTRPAAAATDRVGGACQADRANPSNPARLLPVEMQRWMTFPQCFVAFRHCPIPLSLPYPFVAALSLPPPSPFCHSERSEESAVRPSGAPPLAAHHFHQIIQYSETTPFRGRECAAPQPVPRNGSNVRTMRTRFPPRKILGWRPKSAKGPCRGDFAAEGAHR